GLTLVKRLVAMHGGTVQAKSDGPGCGSEFLVTLPLAEPGYLEEEQNGLPPKQRQRLASYGFSWSMTIATPRTASAFCCALRDSKCTWRTTDPLRSKQCAPSNPRS